MSKKLVLLSRNLIKVNQPLLCPVFKEDGTLLAQKGMVLNDEQVDTLFDLGTLYTLGKELAAAITPTRFRSGKEVENGKYIWRSPFNRLAEIRNDLIRILQDPAEKGHLERIQTMVGRVHTICLEAPDAALATIMIDPQENYAAQHALHVAIICDLTAAYLEWNDAHRMALVAAALTMNLSLGLTQNDLQCQAEPLSDEQRKQIQRHPIESMTLLREMGVTNKRWLEYVATHHEDIDGTGYPQKLMHDEIPLGSSLLHVADIYTAKVSGRSYRMPKFPNVAVREIFMGKDRAAKGTVIEILVKLMGLYPPGCQVSLVNGETAVVVKRGNRVDAPHVKVLIDAVGQRLHTPTLLNTNNQKYAVKDVIQPNVIRYDPDFATLWGY